METFNFANKAAVTDEANPLIPTFSYLAGKLLHCKLLGENVSYYFNIQPAHTFDNTFWCHLPCQSTAITLISPLLLFLFFPPKSHFLIHLSLCNLPFIQACSQSRDHLSQSPEFSFLNSCLRESGTQTWKYPYSTASECSHVSWALDKCLVSMRGGASIADNRRQCTARHHQ